VSGEWRGDGSIGGASVLEKKKVAVGEDASDMRGPSVGQERKRKEEEE
jgi:hypothetical protein